VAHKARLEDRAVSSLTGDGHAHLEEIRPIC
jgi:hypothetical protein